jgi:hypothetical protein
LDAPFPYTTLSHIPQSLRGFEAYSRSYLELDFGPFELKG